MKQKIKHFVALITMGLLLIVFTISCKPDTVDFERPADLAGTVYEQLESLETFTYYLKCLDRTEYATPLLKGGSWTVFVPTDIAFEQFMVDEGYASFEDIPDNRIQAFIEYSIVTDAYNTTTLTYFRSGWYEGQALRRHTHFQDSVVVVNSDDYPNFIDYEPGVEYNLDQSTGSLKTINYFLPSYFYFDRHPTEFVDYDFMFPGETFGANDMKVSEAHVEQQNLPAENGIIYVLDKVVEERPNLYENLSSEEYGGKYSLFKSLIERFGYFSDRGEIENRNTGVLEDYAYILFQTGIEINRLAYNPNAEPYPKLVNNVDRTWANATGLIVPTNQALLDYLEQDNVLGREYESYDDMSQDVIGMFLGIFFFQDFWSLCPSHTGSTFNIAIKLVDYNVDDAIDKKFCSNGFFVGVDKIYTNTNFETIMGPILVEEDYSIMLKSIQGLGLETALLSTGINFSILGIKNYQFTDVDDPNSATRKITILDYNEDLSIIYMQVTGDPNEDNNRVYPPLGDTSPLATDVAYVNATLQSIVLNQIINESIDPTSNNYYQTRSGEFVYANSGTFINGGGDIDADRDIRIYGETQTVNGILYDMSSFVERPSNFVYGALNTDLATFSLFIDVMEQAGAFLAIPDYPTDFLLSFTNPSKTYTLLAPNNVAVNQAIADGVILDPNNLTGLTDVEAAQAKIDFMNFTKLHFLQYAIPTDGKREGTFESAYSSEIIDFKAIYDEFTIENNHTNSQLTIKNPTTGDVVSQTSTVTNLLSKKIVIHEIDIYLKF